MKSAQPRKFDKKKNKDQRNSSQHSLEDQFEIKVGKNRNKASYVSYARKSRDMHLGQEKKHLNTGAKEAMTECWLH